jgi:hypothetical protein
MLFKPSMMTHLLLHCSQPGGTRAPQVVDLLVQDHHAVVGVSERHIAAMTNPASEAQSTAVFAVVVVVVEDENTPTTSIRQPITNLATLWSFVSGTFDLSFVLSRVMAFTIREVILMVVDTPVFFSPDHSFTS